MTTGNARYLRVLFSRVVLVPHGPAIFYVFDVFRRTPPDREGIPMMADCAKIPYAGGQIPSVGVLASFAASHVFLIILLPAAIARNLYTNLP